MRDKSRRPRRLYRHRFCFGLVRSFLLVGILGACQTAHITTLGRTGFDAIHPTVKLSGTIDPGLELNLRIEYQVTRAGSECSGIDGETGRVFRRVEQNLPPQTSGRYSIDLLLDPQDPIDCAFQPYLEFSVVKAQEPRFNEGWSIQKININAHDQRQAHQVQAREISCSQWDKTGATGRDHLACFYTALDKGGERCGFPTEPVQCDHGCQLQLNVHALESHNLRLTDVAKKRCPYSPS